MQVLPCEAETGPLGAHWSASEVAWQVPGQREGLFQKQGAPEK